MDTEFDSLSSVLVAAGDVASWQVSTDADGGVSGIINQGFSVTYAGQTVELSVPINVSAVGDLSITGPMDSRIQLKPSSDVITNFTLTNSGTADLTVVAYLSGLPAGVESEVSDSSIDIPAGGQAEVSLTLLADSTVAAGSYSLTFAYGGEGVSDSLDLDLQVSHRYAVKTSATNSQVVAGPLEWEELSIDVTNLGSTSDTIQLTLDDNGASQWYEFELSSTSLSLTSGEAETVTLRIREKSAGSEDLNISITASSSSDLEVTDTMVIDLAALQSGASITIVSDDDSAKPGDSVYGSVIITNTGNGYDELQLTTPNYNCGVSQVIALEAGASSAAIPWSCDIGGDEIAGLKELPFRVTSQARSTAIYEESEIFTVEEVWDDQLVALVVGGTPVSMPSSGGSSMTVTLTNLANADITGSLSTLGAGEGLFVIEWKRLSDNENTTDYSLGPGQSVDFAIKFNSLVRTQEKAVLKIRATSQVGETTFSDETQDFTVSITGPAMPPSGIALPFGIAIDNTNSIYAVLSGWGLAILLITYIRKRKTVTASEEEETADEADQTEEVEEEEESPLGYNECRMDDGGKISCPSCNSRLGVPRGSEPPFRFTCPSCENKIRVVE